MNEFDPDDNSSDPNFAKSQNKQTDKSWLPTPLGRYFSLFFLFFAVALSCLSLYVVYWLSSELDSEIEDMTKVIEARFNKEENSIDGINERIFSIEQTMISTISQLEGRIESGEDRLVKKISGLDRAIEGTKVSREHIRLLLREANRALYWYRDVDHAVRLLRDVDILIQTAGLDEYRSFQEVILGQVRRLESSEVLGFAEFFVKLDELADLVDELEVLSEESSKKRQVEEYDSYWEEFKAALDQLVRVRKVSRATDGFNLLNSIDARLLKLEWKLYVQEIRLTVLNQDQRLYLELVQRFEHSIAKIKPTIPALDVLQTKVDEISSYNVSPLSSDIDEILKRIQKVSGGS